MASPVLWRQVVDFGGHVTLAYIRDDGTERGSGINLLSTLAGLVTFERKPSPGFAAPIEGSRQRALQTRSRTS